MDQETMFRQTEYDQEGGYDINYIGSWDISYTPNHNRVEVIEKTSDDGVDFYKTEKTTYTYEEY